MGREPDVGGRGGTPITKGSWAGGSDTRVETSLGIKSLFVVAGVEVVRPSLDI